MSRAPSAQSKPMKTQYSRRNVLTRLGRRESPGCSLFRPRARPPKRRSQKIFVSSGAPKDYDPTKHKWLMCVDVNKLHRPAGLCVEACKKENSVPEGPYFRTWIERYIIPKPGTRFGQTRGENLGGFPNGGMHGFPPSPCAQGPNRAFFFVPKLCNLCEHSPCVPGVPVGATFDAPDGARC